MSLRPLLISVVCLLGCILSLAAQDIDSYIGHPVIDGVELPDGVTLDADAPLFADHSPGALKAQTALYTTSSELARMGQSIAVWVEISLNGDNAPSVTVSELPSEIVPTSDYTERFELMRRVPRESIVDDSPPVSFNNPTILDAGEQFIPSRPTDPGHLAYIESRLSAHLAWHPWNNERRETLGFVLNSTSLQSQLGFSLEFWQRQITRQIDLDDSSHQTITLRLVFGEDGSGQDPEVLFPRFWGDQRRFQHIAANLDLRLIDRPSSFAFTINKDQSWPIPLELDANADRDRPRPVFRIAPEFSEVVPVELMGSRIPVSFRILEDGSTFDVVAHADVPEWILTACEEAVSRWRFLPVRRDGEPISMPVRIAIAIE